MTESSFSESVSTAALQQWLLLLNCPPKGLVSSKTGKPDGIFGSRTLECLGVTAYELGYKKVDIRVAEDRKSLSIAPSESMEALRRSAEVAKAIKTEMAKSLNAVEFDANGFPVVDSGIKTLGQYAIDCVKLSKLATIWQHRVDSLTDANKSKIKKDYANFFIAAQASVRLFAERLNSDVPKGIRKQLSETAPKYGVSGDDVINQLGRTRLPASSILSLGPNLAPLQPFLESELGWVQALLSIPLLATIGASVVAGIGMWNAPSITKEWRYVQESQERHDNLIASYDAIAKGIVNPGEAKDLTQNQKPDVVPGFDFSTALMVAGGVAVAAGGYYFYRQYRGRE